MSMNQCFECGKIYDTDYESEVDSKGNMVCNECWNIGGDIDE